MGMPQGHIGYRDENTGRPLGKQVEVHRRRATVVVAGSSETNRASRGPVTMAYPCSNAAVAMLARGRRVRQRNGGLGDRIGSHGSAWRTGHSRTSSGREVKGSVGLTSSVLQVVR